MTKKNSAFPDFLKKESFSNGAYLSETGEILYADSRYDEEKQRRINEIVLENVKTHERRILTAGGVGERSPMLSPDHKRVCFISMVRGKGTQLYVYHLDTDECIQLTNMRFGLMEPLWSPDGSKILFTSFSSGDMDEDWLQTQVDPEEAATYARQRAKEPVVITDFGYKFDGLGFAQPEVMQLWVIDAETDTNKEIRKAARITSEAANFMHANWAPDCEHILCESNLYCNKEIGIAMDVLSISLTTKEIVRLTQDKIVVSYPNPVRPVYTPDGKYLIIGILDYELNDNVHTTTYPSCSLYRMAVDGSEITKIFEKTEECYDAVQFAYNAGCGQGLEKVRISSDGKYVLFHSGSNGRASIWRVPIYGDEHIPVLLTPEKAAWNGMGVPENGKVLAVKTEINKPEGYYLLDEKTGEYELLVQSNRSWLDGEEARAFSNADDFFYETLDGKSCVHGFALPPQNAQPGKKYPAIVYVHGGPHPFYTYGFDLEMQCFAGEGFGVLFCNPRGSSGYGDKHRELHYSNDGSAYTDIMQLVNEAVRRCDWIDENRLGMTGGSYGGYMTNYTATRSDKFKAYITQRSVVNELIDYASSDMQGHSKEYPTFGEFMVHEIEESTICGMEKVSAPFLILHGIDDYRCPVEGAHQLFVALKDTHPEDFPIKMVLYPHCGHEQPSDPKQLQHYYRTMTDWFKKYL